MTPNGMMSPPGIFAGYHFDTVSTRFIPGRTMPLRSSISTGMSSGSRTRAPGVMLWHHERAGIGEHACGLRQGRAGSLGSREAGAGTATMLPWNSQRQRSARRASVLEHSGAGHPPSSPGVCMYSCPLGVGLLCLERQLRSRARLVPQAAGGGSELRLLRPSWARSPPASDPTLRSRSPAQFMAAARFHNLEYLSEPNSILRDIDPDPDVYNFASMLDYALHRPGRARSAVAAVTPRPGLL